MRADGAEEHPSGSEDGAAHAATGSSDGGGPELPAAGGGGPELPEAGGGGLELPATLRALRRRADLSQRELAVRSGVPAGTLARIESGAGIDPRLRTVERLVRATGARLAVLDLDGGEPVPLLHEQWRDRGGRRFPPHVDPRPVSRWRKGREERVIGFRRERRARDERRRDTSGERRYHVFTEVRLLTPSDVPVLPALRAAAAADGTAPADSRERPVAPAVDAEDGLRYVRDPALRHWVVEEHGRLRGQLVAHVHRRYARPPMVVVTEAAVPEPLRSGVVGRLLVAALRHEAGRLGTDEVVALPVPPTGARQLRDLGFVRQRRSPLLRLPA